MTILSPSIIQYILHVLRLWASVSQGYQDHSSVCWYQRPVL